MLHLLLPCASQWRGASPQVWDQGAAAAWKNMVDTRRRSSAKGAASTGAVSSGAASSGAVSAGLSSGLQTKEVNQEKQVTATRVVSRRGKVHVQTGMKGPNPLETIDMRQVM